MKTVVKLAAIALATGLPGIAHATGPVFMCYTADGTRMGVDSQASAMKVIFPGEERWNPKRSDGSISVAASSSIASTVTVKSLTYTYVFAYWVDSATQKPVGKLERQQWQGHTRTKSETYACASDITWVPAAF